MASTAQSTQSWKTRTTDFFNKKGRLNLWANLIGVQSLQDSQAENLKNQQAENQWYRKQMGYEPESEDDVSTTILGDVFQQPTPQAKQGLSTLAAIGIGLAAAGIPVAGVGGFVLSQMLEKSEPTQVIDTNTDETVSIGLGRIEDYIKEEN